MTTDIYQFTAVSDPQGVWHNSPGTGHGEYAIDTAAGVADMSTYAYTTLQRSGANNLLILSGIIPGTSKLHAVEVHYKIDASSGGSLELTYKVGGVTVAVSSAANVAYEGTDVLASPQMGGWTWEDLAALTVECSREASVGLSYVYGVEILVSYFPHHWPLATVTAGALPNTSNRANALVGADASWQTAGNTRRLVMPCAGAFKRLHTEVTPAPGGSGYEYFSVTSISTPTRVLSTENISGTDTSGEDAYTKSFGPFEAGDSIDGFSRLLSGSISNQSAPTAWTTEIYADKFPCFVGSTGALSTTADSYTGLQSQAVPSTGRVDQIIPEPGTIADLTVFTDVGTPGSGHYEVTLLRGVAGATTTATSVTVNVTGSAGSVIQDLINSQHFDEGDKVGFLIRPVGNPGSCRLSIAVTWVSDVDPANGILLNIPGAAITNDEVFCSWLGSTWDATEANRQAYMFRSRIKKILVQCNTAPGSGKTRTVAIRRRLANASPARGAGTDNSDLTVSLTGTATTGTEVDGITIGSATHDLDLDDGDLLCVHHTATSGAALTAMRFGIVFSARPDDHAPGVGDSVSDSLGRINLLITGRLMRGDTVGDAVGRVLMSRARARGDAIGWSFGAPLFTPIVHWQGIGDTVGDSVGRAFVSLPEPAAAELIVVAPNAAPIGYPVILFAEYSDFVTTYPMDDNALTIKLFKLDDTGARAGIQGPGLMSVLGEGYVYTWTPTEEGAYLIQVAGTFLDEPKIGTRTITARNKWDPNALKLYNLLIGRL